MAVFEDLVGKKFSRLVVEAIRKPGSNSSAVWICKCECGKRKLVQGGALHAGTVRSCGCLRSAARKNSKAVRLKQKQQRVHRSSTDTTTLELRARWSRKHASAKQRGLVFELTYLQWLQVVSQPCVFCGQAPAPRSARQSYQGDPIYCSSVDRISSSLGYILGNVQPTCDQCNIMKSEMTNQSFINLCTVIARRHQCS